MNLVHIFELLFLLIGILFACLAFANAIENLGSKLKLGSEVTGSILAAVGTALPETIVPVVAIFLASQAHTNGAKEGIAIGSIIGAPFLLGTLALLLLGLTVLLHRKKRGSIDLDINPVHVKRDIRYFLIIFSIGILASYIGGLFKIAAAVLLSFGYAIYVFQTISTHDSDVGPEEEFIPKLYLSRLKAPNTLFMVIFQTLLGLLGIIFFAEKFVHALESASSYWGIDPLILSLIVTPIATELPEKVNSCLWASESKDSLAIGNITGAMVFQASIPCTIGVLFTHWELDSLTMLCSTLAILGSVILWASLKFFNKINAYTLIGAGSLYLIYIVAILVR